MQSARQAIVPSSNHYTNSWGGFLPSVGRARQSKTSDEELLNIAKNEQHKEMRDGEQEARRDFWAAQTQAAVKAQQKSKAAQPSKTALHRYTSAWGGYLPKMGHKSTTAATTKAAQDMRLLESAEAERRGERRQAEATKQRDQLAARLRQRREAVRKAAAAKAKAAGARAETPPAKGAAQAKRTVRAAVQSVLDKYTSSWGGWLPSLTSKTPQSKHDEELKLFQAAQRDQDNERTAGQQLRQRDQEALAAKQREALQRGDLGGRVHSEAQAELSRIQRLASDGLRAASAADASEAAHAWGHLAAQD
mmetsp:Transcript_18590/g.51356  ORF Transcript_18590/g.51356 Transcript_18590/m.51356 type:complete len:306 (-) Transcript_18590:271-1188(-)